MNLIELIIRFHILTDVSRITTTTTTIIMIIITILFYFFFCFLNIVYFPSFFLSFFLSLLFYLITILIVSSNVINIMSYDLASTGPFILMRLNTLLMENISEFH